jgi:site-specific recombinase XerD
LYRTRASPFWIARVWLPGERRYFVKTTKETSKTAARDEAERIFDDLKQGKRLDRVSRDRAFETFAEKLLANDERESGRSLHRLTASNEKTILCREPDGVLKQLGRMDVGDVRTTHVRDYLNWLEAKRSRPLSSSTKSKHLVVIRKVLRLAYEAGVIAAIPPMPRIARRDNPRNHFSEEEYENLFFTARELAEAGAVVRGVPVTPELQHFVSFLVETFLRPTESEVFALQHQDVAIRPDTGTLRIRVRKAKTKNALEWTETAEYAVRPYDAIKALRSNFKPTDYVFLPDYLNRATAKRVMQNQFRFLLGKAGLTDANGGRRHSLYSLRHTAICLRLLHSKGQVNLLNLAKNARTSVSQIERFYASQLPMSKEMVENLQSFGEG